MRGGATHPAEPEASEREMAARARAEMKEMQKTYTAKADAAAAMTKEDKEAADEMAEQQEEERLLFQGGFLREGGVSEAGTEEHMSGKLPNLLSPLAVSLPPAALVSFSLCVFTPLGSSAHPTGCKALPLPLRI